jgi:hypothetical protein
MDRCLSFFCNNTNFAINRGRRGLDSMIVGIITTNAISAYHYSSCEFETCSWRDVLDTTLCDKVCQWLAGQWFTPGTLVSSTNKNKHVNGFLLKYSIVQNVSKCLIKLSPHDVSTSICKKKYFKGVLDFFLKTEPLTNYQCSYGEKD